MIRISHHRIKGIVCNYCAEVAPSNRIMNQNDRKSTLLDSKEKKGMYISISPDDEVEDNLEATELYSVNIIRVEKI